MRIGDATRVGFIWAVCGASRGGTVIRSMIRGKCESLYLSSYAAVLFLFKAWPLDQCSKVWRAQFGKVPASPVGAQREIPTKLANARTPSMLLSSECREAITPYGLIHFAFSGAFSLPFPLEQTLYQVTGEQKVGDALLHSVLVPAVAAHQLPLRYRRLDQQVMQVLERLLIRRQFLCRGCLFWQRREAQL